MIHRQFLRARLMLDRCSEEWCVTPCTASGATPCYKTRCTCQSVANYAPVATAVPLCTAHQPVPHGVQAEPCIVDVEHVPTRIDLKAGLGRRDEFSLECDDFEDCGETLDPYWSRRPSWDRKASFFARLKAIHKHYAGRTLYVDEGELDELGRVATLTTRNYVLDRIDGPSSGRVSIVAKDVLWRLENAMVPAPSVGELLADLTAVATTFAFKTSGDGTGYGTAPFTVRIDDEIMLVGARSGDTCSTISRGQCGTTAAEHDADAKVQLCATWVAQAPDVIWADILDRAGIASALVDTTGAAAEAVLWFSGYLLSGCISEPTKAADLIADLTQQVVAFTWWDASAQLCRLKGIHPLSVDDSIAVVDDEAHVVGRSVTIKDQDAERISRVDCYYGVRDWSQSLEDGANYLRRVLAIDASAESAAEYNEVRDTRKLWCYFCPTTMEVEVEALTARVLDRYRDAPRLVTVEITADDATQVAGELVTLTAREMVDADGLSKATTCWVLAVAQQGGDSIAYRYEMLVDTDQTVARYAFVNYDACPGYDTATDEDKTCAFCADDTTEMVGSDPPYCVI